MFRKRNWHFLILREKYPSCHSFVTHNRNTLMIPKETYLHFNWTLWIKALREDLFSGWCLHAFKLFLAIFLHDMQVGFLPHNLITRDRHFKFLLFILGGGKGRKMLRLSPDSVISFCRFLGSIWGDRNQTQVRYMQDKRANHCTISSIPLYFYSYLKF